MKLTIKECTSDKEWNTYIQTWNPEAFFQTWEWGEVQKTIGVLLKRFVYVEHSTPVGIAEITTVRAKRGSFLHVRHGPVVKKCDLVVYKEILSHIIDYAKQSHVWFIRVSPIVPPDSEYISIMSSFGGIPSAIHQMDGEIAWVLDLTPSVDELLLSMRKTTRYEIKRSYKMDINVDMSGSNEAVNSFLDLYNKTAERQGFVEHKGIKEELDIFLKKNIARLYVASFNHEVISGAVILYSNNQAIYHHGASIPSKIPASYRIQWEAIQDSKKKGLSIYNFWGVAMPGVENHPWKGITLFKQGFGGRLVEYLHAYDIPISSFYKLTRTVDTIRKIRKGYS
jgi:lipid II:glycine glycyltransferase (peptidoglycan interpeptide bridge formation enzyme)